VRRVGKRSQRLFDVPAKGVEDSSLKQKKMGLKWTHGHAHWLMHGHAAGAETCFSAGEGKERGRNGVVSG